MKSKWGLAPILLFGLAIVLSGSNSQGALIYEDTFYLDIFTDNGIYADDSEVNLYVEVFRDDSDADLVYFEFHNDSTMYSSIANIYFDDGGSLLSEIDSIDNGPGTLFNEESSPPGLPAGNDIFRHFRNRRILRPVLIARHRPMASTQAHSRIRMGGWASLSIWKTPKV